MVFDVPVILPEGWSLIRREAVSSTNAELQILADGGAEEGTVLWALRQTAGRARRDRLWESVEGNLFCSILVRPRHGLSCAGLLSFLSAVAVAEALEAVVPGLTTVCKWPNDVLGSKGKLSGILLESCDVQGSLPTAVVVGIGINVVWHPGKGALFPASSLAEEGGSVALAGLLEALAARFAAWLSRLRAEGFAPLRQAWLARAKGLGSQITVRLPDETLTGIFESLDEDGALVLSEPGGETRLIRAGDVFFGIPT